MLSKINKEMTLKEIMDIHSRLEDEIKKIGFDVCCSKMESLESSCKKRNIEVEYVLKKLNEVVEELNFIEELTKQVERNLT